MAQASGQQVTIGSQTITSGSGAPAGVDAQGSIYLRTDGSTTATRLYVQGTSGSTTGWVAVTTAS